jgi:sec-independent protein translocase protein TatC
MQLKEMGFFDHIEELRWHVVRVCLFILILTIAVFVFSSFVFNDILFAPLNPDFWSYKLFCKISQDFCVDKINIKLINTEIAGQFYLHLKTAFSLGIMGSTPYLFWEIWRFINPALHKTERSYVQALLLSGFVLFIVGVLFGYFLIFPISFLFMTTYEVSASIANMPNIGNYFDNLSSTVLWSGVMFELPVIMYFLAKVGIVTAAFLSDYRRHLYVAILVVSGAITPSPDIISQLMVALPLVLLYEASIFVVARVERKNKIEEEAF